MTHSYIKDGMFHIETNDEEIIVEVLDRVETHILDDTKKCNYERAGERIASFIEMDKNYSRWKEGEL